MLTSPQLETGLSPAVLVDGALQMSSVSGQERQERLERGWQGAWLTVWTAMMRAEGPWFVIAKTGSEIYTGANASVSSTQKEYKPRNLQRSTRECAPSQ